MVTIVIIISCDNHMLISKIFDVIFIVSNASLETYYVNQSFQLIVCDVNKVFVLTNVFDLSTQSKDSVCIIKVDWWMFWDTVKQCFSWITFCQYKWAFNIFCWVIRWLIFVCCNFFLLYDFCWKYVWYKLFDSFIVFGWYIESCF